MKKHLLVYDYDWWILGQKARIIKKYHPSLDIFSNKGIRKLVQQKGSAYINSNYEIISALSLGLAKLLYNLNIRVDTAQVGSYKYFMLNHTSFEEWSGKVVPNHEFIKVMNSMKQFGANNPMIKEVVQRLVPDKKVNYIRQFVDSDFFYPLLRRKKQSNSPLNIGWVGNTRREVKQYNSLYKPIVKNFEGDPRFTFKEATRRTKIPLKEMPAFYHSLDLLLVTASNEGIPNPALEAAACGVPAISTNVGIMKDLAGVNEDFLLVKGANKREFIRKIKYLEKNRDLLFKLQKQARATIMSHWTVEKTIDSWLNTLFLFNNGRGGTEGWIRGKKT
ncbi:glycosyltransferase family 4 protein [Evansella tamaricis]|uniref:Glycosyltransferase family 4 protein n=1 Tax=Evansella tamaricis TaxID=2069301 RepID=A0ABS6JJD7_9BACI|nr:glycosyltransferase family 4 protein [Evansella tamaricis]MBU9713319.1 glycosyltransferase family 4 protein [Evansella tamaricis]